MADETDILLNFCEEEWIQARQSEDQRAIITNIVLVIASASLGLLSQKGLVTELLPVTIFLIILGVYGALTSQKYYERHQFHIERARGWRKRLEELHPKSQINKVREEANAKHSKKFKRLEKIHLHTLWLFLHMTIALMGIALSIIIIIS
jgi:hypothetical protein